MTVFQRGKISMPMTRTRRSFLTTAAGAAGAGLVGTPRALAGESAPETTSVTLAKTPALCNAPQFIAEELLRAEGFTEIRYLETIAPEVPNAVGAAKVDFAMAYASQFVAAIDAGEPVTVLGGVHVGCFELFGGDNVRSIGDLKGKTVGVQAIGSQPHTLVSLMAAQVGLDPKTDIRFIIDPKLKPIELFAAGKIDAFLGFPPEPQELRARKIGHVLVNTALDRPWSQYFCCLLAGNREFVRNNPVASKRVLRAILKSTDLCASDPVRAARMLVDSGFAQRYDYALATLNDNPYDKWREYDPEDTLRFYALRMLETGFIKATPQKIIADGTDWRFLNELKRELKA
jgi:NitT/TauT family transport system substrate-binding protein